jgi:hypothetical protein
MIISCHPVLLHEGRVDQHVGVGRDLPVVTSMFVPLLLTSVHVEGAGSRALEGLGAGIPGSEATVVVRTSAAAGCGDSPKIRPRITARQSNGKWRDGISRTG